MIENLDGNLYFGSFYMKFETSWEETRGKTLIF